MTTCKERGWQKRAAWTSNVGEWRQSGGGQEMAVGSPRPRKENQWKEEKSLSDCDNGESHGKETIEKMGPFDYRRMEGRQGSAEGTWDWAPSLQRSETVTGSKVKAELSYGLYKQPPSQGKES